jgi:hypothetical protein
MTLNNDVCLLLKARGLDLNQAAMLYSVYNESKMAEILGINKSPTVVNGLIRKQFFSEDGKLTEMGLKFCETIFAKETAQDKKEPTTLEDWFVLFWASYPATDKWGWYQKTRSLRFDEDRARRYFFDTVKKGKVSPSQILEALNRELKMRKKNSDKRNELIYMKNCCAWLNEKHYEAYLDDETDDSGSYEAGGEITLYNKAID